LPRPRTPRRRRAPAAAQQPPRPGLRRHHHEDGRTRDRESTTPAILSMR